MAIISKIFRHSLYLNEIHFETLEKPTGKTIFDINLPRLKIQQIPWRDPGTW
jgi:hypothetical protein